LDLEGVWNGCIWFRTDQWQALVNTVMNLQVPYKAGSFLNSWVTVSSSRRTLLHGVSQHGAVPGRLQ
jgi:hypothetical protein